MCGEKEFVLLQISESNFQKYTPISFPTLQPFLHTKISLFGKRSYCFTYLSTLVTFSNVVRLMVWFRTLSLIPITKRGFRTIVLILTLDFGYIKGRSKFAILITTWAFAR